MKHASQMQFGPASCAVPDVIERGPDKWALLQLLTEAAVEYDLSHRTLSVLKALLTFLPQRHIPDGPMAVVFPANRTLSHRLSGMPESTLRRHLARLVRAGVVSRQDSPNRKRFARHRAGQVAIAYGFDLSPLVQLSETLTSQATAARHAAEALAVLRARVLDMRALVIASRGECELTIRTARLIRRKPDEALLCALLEELTHALDKGHATDRITSEVSVSDDQNERHIHNDLKHSNHTTQRTRAEDALVRLADVTEHCTAYVEYFPEKVRNWDDLSRMTNQLVPMLGLSSDTVGKAYQIMGRQHLSVVILCILERFDRIKDPTAFLSGLITNAKNGVFRIETLLKGSKAPNCQLTI